MIILDQFVRPYGGTISPEFIGMDDNAHPHEAIVHMDWPARSQNLNPIEQT